MWLELNETRGEWQEMSSGMEARDHRPKTLEFILRVMERDWRVVGKVVMCSDLCFRNSPFASLWRIDCKRVRIETGRPVRKLFQ